MKKAMKYLQGFLLVIGFSLLALFASAKLHEHILSRAAVRRFEDLRQTTAAKSDSRKESHSTALTATTPNFLLWSERRIKDYEGSFNEHLALPLAVIRISRIKIEAPVLEGTDDITLNRGVGHIAGTAYFGNRGNVGIAGHRDGFFRGLKDIKIGDQIKVEEPERTEIYVVDRLHIVNPRDVSVLEPGEKQTLTLVTCYPFYYIGSAPQRFIVHAVLAHSEQNVVRASNESDQATREASAR